MEEVIKYLEEIKEHQMQTVQLARSTEVYKLADKALKAIDVIHCCKSDSDLLKDKEVLSFEDWVKHNYKEGKHRYYSLNGLNCLSYEEVLQKYNVYKQSL